MPTIRVGRSIVFHEPEQETNTCYVDVMLVDSTTYLMTRTDAYDLSILCHWDEA